MRDIVTHLRERAAGTPKRIVYPEAADPRVLRAAEHLVRSRMAKPVLLGAPQVVQTKAKEIGVSLAHVEIVDPKTRPLIERYAGLLLPDWKSRGVTEVEALKRLENPM